MARTRILVVDDEASVTGAIALILGGKGHDVKTAGSASEAARLITSQPFDLVFSDLRLPDASGIELLTRIKENTPETEVILITAHGSLDITIDAIKRGAFYYAEKPILPDQLIMLVERALQFAAIKRENQTLKRTLARDGEDFGLIGSNPQMRHIHEVIRTTAPSDASVLIEGESGTGKELIATAFHMQSQRADRPFIRINCAAIPQELIESELFGYKKGAFTGADRDKRGLIEASNGGTLLLDEIAEMPAHLQSKLLRVLQEHKIRRLGDDQESPVDFRLVSATNRDTAIMMQDGSMRKDLYFRISTIKIKVLPLRDRLDDVVLLAERFLRQYAQKYNRNVRNISTQVLSLLSRYDWPGNVRELESVIEHAVLFCRGSQLVPADLPEQIHVAHPTHFKCLIPPYFTMEEIEREAIEQTLGRTGGNVKRTAQILHYHRPTLYRKLRKFGLRSDANHGDIDTENAPYMQP